MWSVLYTLIFAFGTAYFIIEKTGLTGAPPASVREVFYSAPVLICSVLLLVAVLVSSIGSIRKHRVTGWLALISTICIVSGIWVSYLTGFSGEVILTEGQTFYSGHDSYMPETLYVGKFASVPDVGMMFEKLYPSLSDDRRAVKGLKGTFQHVSKDEDKPGKVDITDGIPKLIGGSWFRIKGMGYSPRYVLKTKTSREMNSAFVFMRLFPPGSEDNFRLLSPHTYYLRYYPSGKDGGADPVLRLRIVRNKDIVLNQDVKLSEEVEFENSRISIEEVRMWTKLSIIHDWGAVPALCGILLGCITLVMRSVKSGSI